MIRSRNSVAGINSSSTIYYDHRENIILLLHWAEKTSDTTRF